MQTLANQSKSDYFFANGTNGLNAAAIGDPYYSNVVLQLKMTGTNGSSTFTDLSNSKLTINKVGSPVISTAYSKWGEGSGYFPTGTNQLEIADTAILGLGTSDFTFEMWVYRVIAVRNYDTLFEMGTGGAPFQNGLMLRLQTWTDPLYIANTPYNWTPSTNFPIGRWNHLALVRSGNTWNLYINGAAVSGATNINNTSNIGSTSKLSIGGALYSTGLSVESYINDLRLTKGIARYTSNFTPPTAPFPTF